VRGLSSGWKDNDIGKRLMQTLAAAQPLTEAEMPPSTRAARRWARKARWWPICSSCC
jgi:ribonuclease D